MVLLPRVCKTCRLPSWTPSLIYQIVNDTCIASLGCYNDYISNSRINKITILYANPWSLPVSGKIFSYFLQYTAILAAILSAFLFCFLFGYMLSVFNQIPIFIAINFRKKMSLRHFPCHTIFSLIIGLHLGRHLEYIEMLNDARVASLGFFKDNVCTNRINKEKKFKIKFQVLLKFAQILRDYYILP